MRIFAIDDELPLLNTAKRTICEAVPDAEVFTFSTAASVLDAIENQHLFPDVVFSDIEMPGMSGLELAVKMKTLAPDTRIIFVTGFSQYALDAFKVRAQGFIMKPLTIEAVREELNAIPTLSEPEPGKLFVRCFGKFEVFWKGKPLIFQRKQTKELFAFLVDREGSVCSSEEINEALWESEYDQGAANQRIRNLVNDLKNTLHGIGMDKVLVRNRKQLSIRRDQIDCDYYRLLSGNVSEFNSFRGEYMVDYSWAELTAAKLYFREN